MSQTAEPPAMTMYHALRNPSVGTEAFTVKDLVLKRDAAVFTLHSGTVCLLAPVNGVVTGAVFNGTGDVALSTDSAVERGQLTILQSGALTPFDEEFEKLVLRFSDATADEIRKSPAVTPAASPDCKPGLLSDINGRLRSPIRYNIAARLLQDVEAHDTNGIFYAFIDGKKYSSKMLYAIDPHGLPELLMESDRSGTPSVYVAPEEVALLTYDERRFGVWYARHLLPEYAAGTATGTQQNALVHARNHTLDVTIEKNGYLRGTATTTLESSVAGLQVVTFDLFETLRVESATDGAGLPLTFIQEEKRQDPQYSVLLAKPLQKGETFTIVTKYSGKDAVESEGNANYYPVARTNWYPNTRFGEYANYDMTLRVPTSSVTVATGKLLSTTTEADKSVTHWKSEAPMAVAGFILGGFKEKSNKLQGTELTIDAYANVDPDKYLKTYDNHVFGSINTTGGLQQVLDEGSAAAAMYTNLFGTPSYSHF
ncbi:MAG TPA: hypothetical protein VMT89_16850, partial [Candidatus Acidoferrales bacterium]|nr:hypothetical protein [Candidatus Acidoferrales bacterium]